MATKRVFTASSTAEAINSITRMHGKDLEALMEVIGDYFDDEERETEYNSDDDIDPSGHSHSEQVSPSSNSQAGCGSASALTLQEAAGTASEHSVHCDFDDMVALEPTEHIEGQHAHTLSSSNFRKQNARLNNDVATCE